MYAMRHFTESNRRTIIDFMKAHPFALLIGNSGAYPVATHIPVEVTEKDQIITITGHVMRKTDHHKALEQNDKALVVFNGPHSYVSASWYAEQPMASTWNYMTVHAKGKIAFTDDDGTVATIKALTDKYEGKNAAASFDRLSPEYIAQNVKAIVAFTMEVESLENVFKLSQNRTVESKKNIIDHLRKTNDPDAKKIADEIEKRL